MLRDMEDTVVHELVHLTLAPVVVDLERTEANRHELENTVNHVTAALLRAQGSQ
jgi:rhamnogalacturonyl hydrolase YesR